MFSSVRSKPRLNHYFVSSKFVGLIGGVGLAIVRRQRLDKVEVNQTAMRTGHTVTVVAEELKTVLGRDHHLVAVVASEAFRTARRRREDVVGIHSAQDELRSRPHG